MNIQYLPLKKQKELQFKRLKKILNLAYNNSLFYRKRFEQANIKPEDIKSFEDYQKIPIMDKNDLYHENLFDFSACPLEEIQIVFASSMSSSTKPKYIMYSRGFWQESKETMKHILNMAKLTPLDNVAILRTFSMAPAAHSILHCLTHHGAFVVPIGTGSDFNFITDLLKRMKVTAIFSSPISMISFTKYLEEKNLDSTNFYVNKIYLGGMPLSNAVRNYLKKKWKAEVFMFAGAVESFIQGFECPEHNGMHICPNLVYFEVINPKTNKPVEEEQIGESVITTLTNTAMPLFRFKLDDLIKISAQPCSCGRTTARLWILGRTKETIFLAGAHKLHAFQIEEALSKVPEASGQFHLILTKEENREILNYHIEIFNKKNINEETLKKVENALKNISVKHKHCLEEGVFKIKINLVEKGTLPKSSSPDKQKLRINDLRPEI